MSLSFQMLLTRLVIVNSTNNIIIRNSFLWYSFFKDICEYKQLLYEIMLLRYESLIQKKTKHFILQTWKGASSYQILSFDLILLLFHRNQTFVSGLALINPCPFLNLFEVHWEINYINFTKSNEKLFKIFHMITSFTLVHPNLS